MPDQAVDLASLDKLLAASSYLRGSSATQEDLATWAKIPTCPAKEQHVARWWKHVEALKKSFPYRKWPVPEVEKDGKRDAKKDQASLDNTLVNAVKGRVVTRFPPEPSGYLHIGHAKAALLNATYAEMYGGKCLLRFDDTNPSKEKEEYQQAILEDLQLLEINHQPPTYTSDYISELEKDMEKMIKGGHAYVDSTSADQMKVERDAGVESKCRSQPVEENLRMWREMLKGSEEGLKLAVRGKIDMQCPNKCMRDPVFYRCKVDVPHHRHGNKFKAYPTYDFCCAIVDAREGVSHALRSLEYSDRKAMYYWVLEHTGCKNVELTEFSRMNFDHTVLSKRKLTKLVDEGLVSGWDDPRMPTVRGILRRGMTVAALKEFVMTIGSSRNTNSMEWDKIWAINKQTIDPIIPRYCAISSNSLVKFTLSDGPPKPECKEEQLHPKDPSMGTKKMYKTKEVYLKLEDCGLLSDGEEVTLMHWGNAVIDKLTKKGDQVVEATGHLHLEGNPKTTKYKLNWLPVSNDLIDVTLRELGHLFTEPTFPDDDWEKFFNHKSMQDASAKGEVAMLNLKKGERLQLERGGYYIVDQVSPMILVEIPDGKAKKISGQSRQEAPPQKDQGCAKEKAAAGGEAGGKEKGGKEKGAAKAKAAPAVKAADRPLDDVSRLDLRVGKLSKVWAHPEADKLWCEEVDIGTEQPLSVCSGLRAHFTQEQMEGRLVVLIANMKPCKMVGFPSQGMVLCAVNGDKVELLAPPVGSKPGDRVLVAGYDGEPDAVLNTKTNKAPLAACQPNLKTNAKCEATYGGVLWTVGGEPVTAPSNADSQIS